MITIIGIDLIVLLRNMQQPPLHAEVSLKFDPTKERILPQSYNIDSATKELKQCL